MNFSFNFNTNPHDDTIDKEEEYQNRLYNKYSSERDNLNRTALEIGARYDKAVFILAGGALALSITFIEKIAPNPTWFSLLFLIGSWFLLLICLVLSLLATSGSQDAIQQRILALDDTYRSLFDSSEQSNSETSKLPDENSHVSKVRSYDRWARRCLIMGLLFLCCFAILNVLTENPNANKTANADKPSNGPSERGTTNSAAAGRGNLPPTSQLNPTPPPHAALKP